MLEIRGIVEIEIEPQIQQLSTINCQLSTN
jgi:hypothetical protein